MMTQLMSWVSPALTAMMPLFVLACGMLLPTYLSRVKQSELERLATSYAGIERARGFQSAQQMADRFSVTHFIIPVAFTTFQVSILSFLTFYGARIDPLAKDFILGGADIVKGDYQNYAMLTLCTVSFAFLGAFIWMIQNLVTRIVSRNINPATFYAMSVNILLATTLAAVLHHIYHGGLDEVMGLPSASDKPSLLIVMAFLTGMAPDIMLDKLRRGLKFFRSEGEAPSMPLTTIQGISSFTAFRLKEMGLDGVQNLAQTNPVELYMMTPASIQTCLDWVGQAQLQLSFPDKAAALGPLGVRTMLDFHAMDDAILAGLTGWSAEQVANAKRRVDQTPSFASLKELNGLLVGAA
ncbi:MAG: hypothetical protein HQL42_07645 [Alphaproteobacteria bacterium]|nr:hypothetical protein [Alphaproteobacteria bacterium]